MLAASKSGQNVAIWLNRIRREGRFRAMTYRMLRAYGQWCTAAGYAENTITDRHELLTRVESDLGNLHRATPAQLTSWLAACGWKPQTRATYFGHLRGYYVWALKAGHISTDPMLNLNRPRVPKRAPRPAREEHYQRIMAEAEPRWRIAATLARYAGLRAAEIARAVRADVDEFDIRVLGKGGRTDMLPTHPAVWKLVDDLPAGHLVLSPRGVPFRPSGISHAFGVRMRKLGVPITLHMLRHSFATTLLRGRDTPARYRFHQPVTAA